MKNLDNNPIVNLEGDRLWKNYKNEETISFPDINHNKKLSTE